MRPQRVPIDVEADREMKARMHVMKLTQPRDLLLLVLRRRHKGVAENLLRLRKREILLNLHCLLIIMVRVKRCGVRLGRRRR